MNGPAADRLWPALLAAAGRPNSGASPAEAGIHWHAGRGWQWSGPARGDALRDKLSELQQQLDLQVERLVTLMVVFALQTLLIPLALFWALLQLCKGLLAGPRQALPK